MSEPKPCNCPHCGKYLDAADAPFDDDARPSPGDYSACIGCNNLSVFADDMSLRKPTDEELKTLAGNAGMRLIMEAIGSLDRRRA